MNLKTAAKIRWIAATVTSLNYLAYLDQANLNCTGIPGSAWLPILALINCILWIVSSYFRKEVDWQTIACCGLGLVTCAVAVMTVIQPVLICSYLR